MTANSLLYYNNIIILIYYTKIFVLTFSAFFFFFLLLDPYGGVAGYPSAVSYGSTVSPTSNGHFAMPPCPPATMLPGASTVAGRGSVIQAAAANCYQPNGAEAANLNDLYYMDFGASSAAMYHQNIKSGNVKIKKPRKYGAVGRPAAVGSLQGTVQQSSCPATGPKRKSREGKYYTRYDFDIISAVVARVTFTVHYIFIFYF